MADIHSLGKRVQSAARQIASSSTSDKNEALGRVADLLMTRRDWLLDQNEKDIALAEERGDSASLLDRLRLTEERIVDMVEGLAGVQALKDPVGEELAAWKIPSGVMVRKVRVPLGAVGIIYEARPNVTIDASALCLKAGNAVLLRGSSSALYSNQALVDTIRSALAGGPLPEDSVILVEDTARSSVEAMLNLNDCLDLIIPRGGADLIQFVVSHAKVPVLATGAGVCHVYIHSDAPYRMAEEIVINSKVQRPAVCNACETLLIDSTWAEQYLKSLIEALVVKGVECRGCEITRRIISSVTPASEIDWDAEYLDLILAVRVVDGIETAIEHINTHGTRHSEAIVTNDPKAAERFMGSVDAAAVYHNASTRFTDGFEFGFGAEIGISTQKLHARGPMGLPELTSYKYKLYGTGQIRQ